MRSETGFTVWLTGLPSAGKSTLAELVGAELESRDLVVEYLDGDAVRKRLSPDLGYSPEDRERNVERIGWIASRLARAGAAVVVSVISPSTSGRLVARRLTEEHAQFVEVFIHASLAECIRRDTKGLYARALAGDLPEFTGISAPYEPPATPDVVIETERSTPGDCAYRILEKLEDLQLVPLAVS
jgi:adenylyl-sulfate kinase